MKLTPGLFVVASAIVMFGCASNKKVWREEKTISMPDCSVAFARSTQGTAYSDRFQNTGLSSRMVVLTPFENPALYQSIADQSCNRLKDKISALGFKVVTGDDLVAKSEKFRALQKEYFTKDVDIRDQFAYFGYSKTGVPKGGPGFGIGMGYASMGRNGDGIIVSPNFSVSFGSVKGSGVSVTDTIGTTTSTTQTKYSPLVTVKSDGSLIKWQAGDRSGAFELSKNISDDSIPWLINIEKRETKTNMLSAVSSLMFGGRQESTSYFTMAIDEAEMKKAILNQLEIAENSLVDQIKDFSKN